MEWQRKYLGWTNVVRASPQTCFLMHILRQKLYTTHYMHHHNYDLLIHYSQYQHHNIRIRLDHILYTVYVSTQNDHKGINTRLFSRVDNQQTIFFFTYTYISNNLKQPTYHRHEIEPLESLETLDTFEKTLPLLMM